MNIQESGWQTPDGLTLYTRTWIPEVKLRSAIVLVHGLGEHCARYDHVAQALLQHGHILYGFDHRGHGRSQGARGDIPTVDVACSDIAHFIEQAQHDHPDLPVFLYGHSMGGLMVLYFTLKYRPEIHGVICTSPGLGTGVPVSPLTLTVGRLLNKFAPSATLNNGLDIQNLSHDPNVVRAYKADPLVTPKISARLAFNIFASSDWAIDHAGEFALPLLLMQGSADHVVSLDLTRKFAQKVPTNLLVYHEWENLYHELHNEPQQAQVLHTILDWLNQQIGES